MLDDRFERDIVEPPPDPRRYPTGVLMLVGMVIGTVGTWAVASVPLGMVPFGTALGLAAGAALDAALNRWLNGEHGV